MRDWSLASACPADDKTEVLVVSNSKAIQNGDGRRSKEHVNYAYQMAAKAANAKTWIISKVGTPRSSKRRLLPNVAG